MPWMINTPDGRQYTCDAFDAPGDGTLHMLNGHHKGSNTRAHHWHLNKGVAPTEFAVEWVEP